VVLATLPGDHYFYPRHALTGGIVSPHLD